MSKVKTWHAYCESYPDKVVILQREDDEQALDYVATTTVLHARLVLAAPRAVALLQCLIHDDVIPDEHQDWREEIKEFLDGVKGVGK